MEIYSKKKNSFSFKEHGPGFRRGVQLFTSLGHPGRRRVVLDHTLNRLWHIITKSSHSVLSKIMILFWPTFIAILGHMGCRSDTPVLRGGSKYSYIFAHAYLFSALSPIIHNVVKWHMHCNLSLSLSLSCTHTGVKENSLELLWHYEFKASTIVSLTASIEMEKVLIHASILLILVSY